MHVWRTDLARPPWRVRVMREALSPEEEARADRFYFEKHRSQYVVAHAVLRAILGRYLNTVPDRVTFQYNEYGKPALGAEFSADEVQFNMARSGDVALYGVTLRRAIGIDVEQVRPDMAVVEIASQFFSPREVAELLQVEPSARLEAFFLCWTRKEAYIKARGAGLSIALDSFEVSLAPGEPATLLHDAESPEEVHRWVFQNLHLGAGYTGAVAMEEPASRIRYWQWKE